MTEEEPQRDGVVPIVGVGPLPGRPLVFPEMPADVRDRVERMLIERFLLDAEPAPPPPPVTMESLMDVAEWCVPKGPVAAQLEAGAIACLALMALPKAPETYNPFSDQVSMLFSVPIVEKADMDPWAWRLLDQDGNEMQAGRM